MKWLTRMLAGCSDPTCPVRTWRVGPRGLGALYYASATINWRSRQTYGNTPFDAHANWHAKFDSMRYWTER